MVVDGVSKTFVLPHERVHTLKERALHPLRSTGSDTRDAVRTVLSSAIRHVTGEPAPFLSGEDLTLLSYEVHATGFLRHMVRAIVGTLVDVGRGRREAASMTRLLQRGRRAEAGATAPPHGLFLVRVDYD